MGFAAFCYTANFALYFWIRLFRQSGTVPGSSRSELPYELPLASLLQIVPENIRNCKNGRIGRWPNAARRRCWTYSGNTSLPSQFLRNLPLGNCRCNAQRGTWIAPYPASRAWTGTLCWYTGPLSLSPVDKASFLWNTSRKTSRPPSFNVKIGTYPSK